MKKNKIDYLPGAARITKREHRRSQRRRRHEERHREKAF